MFYLSKCASAIQNGESPLPPLANVAFGLALLSLQSTLKPGWEKRMKVKYENRSLQIKIFYIVKRL